MSKNPRSLSTVLPSGQMRMDTLLRCLFLLAALSTGLLVANSEAAESELGQQFVSPPASYGPSCFWWWFGCPYTRKDIQDNLDAMKAAGLGGFRIYPVYSFPGIRLPEGVENAPYLSARFLESVREAVQYGVRRDLIPESVLGTGWPFGGPYIPPEMGAGQLKFYSEDLTGPRDFAGSVPGAYATPETLIAVQGAQTNAEGGIDLDSLIDLTSSVYNKTLVKWHVPPGRWKLMTFVGGYTGMKVKRAAPGGEGLVLDHFNRKALDLHLQYNGDVQAPVLKGARAVTMDSWEVFGSNWTPELPQEFQRRRGYSLLRYLPALFLPTGEIGKRLRYDFRLTISDLALDNFFAPFRDWAHLRGFKTRVEAHGTPADILEAYGLTDFPEAETYGQEDLRRLNIRDRKLASSAGHLFGRNQISCESFTWLRYPLFLTTLENMKAAADAIYLDGINHINYHGVPFSPSWAEFPGWYYYAATNVSPGNNLWPYLKYLSEYLRRANYLLQQGDPVADVAVYLPYEDVWSEAFGDWFDLAGALEARLSQDSASSSASMLEALENGGFNFDFINASRIREARIEGPFLCTGPMRYRIVVLPALKAIEPGALQRLRDFCRSGGVVIATDRLPEASPGFKDTETETARVRALISEIFGNNQSGEAKAWHGETRARGNLCGEGEGVFIPRDPAQPLVPQTHLLPRVVSKIIAPDLLVTPADPQVGFVHRNAGDHQIYFIANVSSQEKQLHAAFRISGLHPWVYDAESGSIEPLYQHRSLGQITEAQLALKPWGSAFVVFGANPVPSVISTNLSHTTKVEADGTKAEAEVTANGTFFIRTASGRLMTSVDSLPAPLALSGPWQLTKEKEPARQLEALVSWTSFPEFEEFSGTAYYHCEFGIPEAYLAGGTQLKLDLGEVRDMAEVRVNGQLAGALWKHPFTLDVTRWAKAGPNRLEVWVTNRLINQMRLRPTLPQPYPNLSDRVSQPVSSGLLGPVQLKPVRRVILTQ